MSIDEWRIKGFFLFYLLKKEQSEATSTIRQSSFVIPVSHELHGIGFNDLGFWNFGLLIVWFSPRTRNP